MPRSPRDEPGMRKQLSEFAVKYPILATAEHGFYERPHDQAIARMLHDVAANLCEYLPKSDIGPIMRSLNELLMAAIDARDYEEKLEAMVQAREQA